MSNFIVELIICFLLSFAIGVERQFRRKLIGLRTTILVCIGSFLFVIVSYVVSPGKADMARIPAAVVSGISFLGAGVIIKEGFKVRGLTTAATLWCDSAIGVLCGVGALYEAIIGTALILFINIVLRSVNSKINKTSSNMHTLEEYSINLVVGKKDVLKVQDILKNYRNNNSKWELNINSMNIIDGKEGTNLEIELDILKLYSKNLEKVLNEIYGTLNVKKLDYKKVNDIREEEEEEF